jgi:hypothetical protein
MVETERCEILDVASVLRYLVLFIGLKIGHVKKGSNACA